MNSEDSTVAPFLVSKLFEDIITSKTPETKSKEISFLKTKCMSEDFRTNLIAAEGILVLIKNQILDAEEVVAEFKTFIPNTKISAGVVRVLSGVLSLKIAGKVSNFNLVEPQHPFITLFKINPVCLQLLCDEIRTGFQSLHWLHLNYPFYQFCFCNPNNVEINYHQMKLWMELVKSDENLVIVERIMSWMIFKPRNSIIITSELLNELTLNNVINRSEKVGKNADLILSFQFTSLYHLICENADPRDTLKNILTAIRHFEGIAEINPILLILAKVIVRVSSIYALQVLEICEILIDPSVNIFVLSSLKAALLHWIRNPSKLTTKIVEKCNKIYSLIEMKHDDIGAKIFNLEDYETVPISSNQELYISKKLSKSLMSWRSEEDILHFVNNLNSFKVEFLGRIVHVIFGLFIIDWKNSELSLKLLNLSYICVENFKKFNHFFLTLVTYKLSHCTDSKLHLKLLNCLPNLMNSEENYQEIVSIIRILFNNSNLVVMKTFALKLIYDCWKVNKKCYPHLEELLSKSLGDEYGKFDFYVTKSHIIKMLCEDDSAQIYHRDMVTHLSNILNDCSDQNGDLPSSISLDAIAILCRRNVIDLESTWKPLSQKYVKDKRTRTVSSLCNLAGTLADLLHPQKHENLKDEIVQLMWKYVVGHEESSVRKSAFNALSEFDLEDVLNNFPKEYDEDDEKLEVEKYWITLIKNQEDCGIVGDFFIKMIRKEVEFYPKSIYHQTSASEPIHFSLPGQSVVKSLVEFCKLDKNRNLTPEIHKECMRILSQEYTKPFPPFNWNFLQKLIEIDDSEVRKYCVDIASHQTIISATSRKIIDTFINGIVTKSDNIHEGIVLICKNIKYLANSIQPMILAPFFRKTLHELMDKSEILPTILNYVKEMLDDPDIQEVNKKVFISAIDEKLNAVDINDQAFTSILNCISKLPSNLLEKNVTLFNVNEENYDKSVKVRCTLAMEQENLKFIDSLINSGSLFHNSLEQCSNVLKSLRNNTECTRWTLELLGTISTNYANFNDETIFDFLDIFIVAMVSFSGFYIFDGTNFDISNYIKLFPQSVAHLLQIEEWSNCSSQVMETLYYLNLDKKEVLPWRYRSLFGRTLQASRHNPDFRKEDKWMFHSSCKI